MKRFIKKYGAPLCVCLAACVSLYAFRTIPASHVWRGYRVIAVSDSCPDKTVVSALSATGCAHVISLNLQEIPIAQGKGEALVPYEYEGAAADYLKERTGYFYDRSGKFRLYYVPDAYEMQAESAVRLLNRAGIDGRMDTPSQFPWIPPLLVFFFAVLLTFFSSAPVLFAASALFPVLFAASVPCYLTAVAALFQISASFFALRLWKRKGAVAVILKNPLISVFALGTVIAASATSLRVFLLALCAWGGTASILYVVGIAQRSIDERSEFVPVQIRPAAAVSVVSKKTASALYGCTVLLALMLAVTLFASRSTGSSGMLEVPAQHGAGRSLPGLNDYIVWRWQTQTFPYRSLNADEPVKEPHSGDTVIFPHYSESDTIKEHIDIVFRYDDLYRKKSLSDVDGLPFPAVEQLLKKNGKFGRTGYAAAGSAAGDVKTVILLAAALFLSAGSAVICTAVSKKKQRWSNT